MYRKEFNIALEEAEKINDRIFKGKLVGNGGTLVRETKEILRFSFRFTDGQGVVERVETQDKMGDNKGIKLFTGIINSRYRQVGENVMEVDIIVANIDAYDKVSRDGEEMLRRLRGGIR